MQILNKEQLKKSNVFPRELLSQSINFGKFFMSEMIFEQFNDFFPTSLYQVHLKIFIANSRFRSKLETWLWGSDQGR